MLLEQGFVRDPKVTVGVAARRPRRRRDRAPVHPRQGRRGIGSTWTPNPGVPMTESRFRRVVLKLSGEAFADTSISFGIDAAVVQRIAEEVAEARVELGVEIAIVVGGGNIFRGMSRRDPGHGPGPGRLHGHARDGHQRARAPGRARERRPAHPGPDRDHDGADRRAVHPAAGDPAPREGPDRRVRRRHRQPVLHDRHHRRAARRRDRRRGDPEGHALGRRRRLQRRSPPRPRPR